MKILLSPAKSINEAVEIPTIECSVPVFSKEAARLVKQLKKLRVDDLMELMHVSFDIASLNVNRYKNWHLAQQVTEAVKPAGFLFTGEVYRGLDFNSFSLSEMQQAQQSIRILSGMYGLLRPLDLIYPYRLEMGTRFAIDDKTKNLYQFWGEQLAKQLTKECEPQELIINLASTEYSKAILTKQFKLPVITPVFKEFKNGATKVVMMYAKHARGEMARFLVKNPQLATEELKAYSIGGYSFDEKNSSDSEWVFVR
jgi:hypothetical protein